jgi:spore photoproduct lyase
MRFELDRVVIEERVRDCAVARRVAGALPRSVPVECVADARGASRPRPGAADAFSDGKRRMVIRRREGKFLMACPAGSGEFACCGYLVLVLASNCPMDCSYCFLQEFVADNPALQVYANIGDALDELDALARSAPRRQFRVGTGELADSLAFDTLTGLTRDLVPFVAERETLTLELKTKTDEIENLLELDPRGRAVVAWTLSPDAVWQSSEHGTAPPGARIEAARRVLDAGYRVAFHFDPLIAYEGAQGDYARLIEQLFDTIAPERISFVSMGTLRMTPRLRSIARRRFAGDAMLAGEEVLAPDGRYRAFAPLRLGLYRALAGRLRAHRATIPMYLCMESAAAHERVLGARAERPAEMGARLAQS